MVTLTDTGMETVRPHPAKQLNVLWSSGFTHANYEALFRVSQAQLYVNRYKTITTHGGRLLLAVADPRFPRGVNLLLGTIFAQKLHENEKIWTEKGRTSLTPTPDPPLAGSYQSQLIH